MRVGYLIRELHGINHIAVHLHYFFFNFVEICAPFFDTLHPNSINSQLINNVFYLFVTCFVNSCTIFVHLFQTISDPTRQRSQFRLKIDYPRINFHLECLNMSLNFTFRLICIILKRSYQFTNLIICIRLRLQFIVNPINTHLQPFLTTAVGV